MSKISIVSSIYLRIYSSSRYQWALPRISQSLALSLLLEGVVKDNPSLRVQLPNKSPVAHHRNRAGVPARACGPKGLTSLVVGVWRIEHEVPIILHNQIGTCGARGKNVWVKALRALSESPDDETRRCGHPPTSIGITNPNRIIHHRRLNESLKSLEHVSLTENWASIVI